MPLKNYTSRRWKVTKAEESALCQVTDDVIFPQLVGLGGEVKVLCIKNFYEEGIYKQDINTIEGDGYKIFMSEDGKQIHFHSEGLPLSGGSWTAEDQGPWPGDDE